MPPSKKVRHVQSARPKQSRGAGKASRAVGGATGGAAQRVSADPLHTPVKPEEKGKSSLRTRIDKVLPPFSVQRYVAIWLLAMIPLVGAILILARPWEGSRQPGGTASTATARAALTQTAPAKPTGTGTVASLPISILSTTAVVSGTSGASQPALPPDKYLVIETAKGRVVAKLHTEPQAGVTRTVESFAGKVASGYFDGQQLHRVESWMVQGGDPYGTSRLTAEYNNLPFGPGSLALPHGPDPEHNSDTQFIIFKTETSALDGQYTNLGQVVEGMDVVNKLVEGDKLVKVTVDGRR